MKYNDHNYEVQLLLEKFLKLHENIYCNIFIPLETQDYSTMSKYVFIGV